jgi:hypothetical protein
MNGNIFVFGVCDDWDRWLEYERPWPHMARLAVLFTFGQAFCRREWCKNW